MSFFSGIFEFLSQLGSSENSNSLSQQPECTVNPANGLPMIGGCSGLDIEGNPYGVDFDTSPTHEIDTSSVFDDTNISSFSSWDD